jgi:hypothetical protein
MAARRIGSAAARHSHCHLDPGARPRDFFRAASAINRKRAFHSRSTSIPKAHDISVQHRHQAHWRHGSAGTERKPVRPPENETLVAQLNRRRITMKSFALAAIVALSTLTGVVASAHADTFTVHGYAGDRYGR